MIASDRIAGDLWVFHAWFVLVVQLVSRHSCVADRLPVVVRFPVPGALVPLRVVLLLSHVGVWRWCFRLCFCCFFVSRHTNPFDNAQVIISHCAGRVNFSPCRLWLLLVCVCFGLVGFLVLFCFFFSLGIVMAPLDCVLVLQQHSVFCHLSTEMKEFIIASINGQLAACNSVLIDLGES